MRKIRSLQKRCILNTVRKNVCRRLIVRKRENRKKKNSVRRRRRKFLPSVLIFQFPKPLIVATGGNTGKGLSACERQYLTGRAYMTDPLKLTEHGKDPDEIAVVASRELLPYMRFIKTITTDNGGEFARHERITKSIHGVKVYFSDPYSSWQKGSIENANKLIRQYIPKNTDFNTVTQKFVKQIQYEINNRPRRKLNYISPKELFFDLII